MNSTLTYSGRFGWNAVLILASLLLLASRGNGDSPEPKATIKIAPNEKLVGLSPDGKTLVTAFPVPFGVEHYFYDVSTGKRYGDGDLQLEMELRHCRLFAFSPDTKLAAIHAGHRVDGKPALELWNWPPQAKKGGYSRLLIDEETEKSLASIMFSSDGKSLILTTATRIKIYEVAKILDK
jgi:hypothetical protein